VPRDVSIFYSWQSELDRSLHLDLIGRALQTAARRLTDAQATIQLTVDRDVAGVGGSPDIASVILGKIEASDIFLADVSLIPNGPSRRPTPNANVLLETGYAWHGRGWQRILLVQNTDSGPPEGLPFDLRKHKVITYSTIGRSVADVETILAVDLESALALILGAGDLPYHAPSEVEALEEALKGGRGDRAARAHDVAKWFTSQIRAVAPDLKVAMDQAANRLGAALPMTVPPAAVFAKAADLVAAFGDLAAARGLYEGLAELVDNLEPKADGMFFDHEFDYYRFVGHEAVATLVGLLLKHRKFAVLKDVLSRPMKPGRTFRTAKPYVPEAFTSRCETIETGMQPGSPRMSVRAELLRIRHSVAPLADICPTETLTQGDFLMFLLTSLRVASERKTMWWPCLSVDSRMLRSFGDLLRSREYLSGIQMIVNVPATADFKDRLRADSIPYFDRFWNGAGDWPIDVSQFGSEP
jgi:hypothetical protein